MTTIGPDYGAHDIAQHADGLLRSLAILPAGWHAFTEFDPDAGMLEAGCNLLAWRRYIGACARNLAGRGLAETRRAALGMQLRLTPAGIDLAGERERQANETWAMIDLEAWSGYVESVLGD